MAAAGSVASLLLVTALVLTCPSYSVAWGRGKDAVRLEDVSVLTLRRGRQTQARRSAPIPQLTCVGGDACRDATIEVMQCRNMGSDGVDVQWKCETDLSSDYRLGETVVSCEGYNNRGSWCPRCVLLRVRL